MALNESASISTTSSPLSVWEELTHTHDALPEDKPRNSCCWGSQDPSSSAPLSLALAELLFLNLGSILAYSLLKKLTKTGPEACATAGTGRASSLSTFQVPGTTSPLNVASLSGAGNHAGLLWNPADRQFGTIRTKTSLATMVEKTCYKRLQMTALGERERARFTFCTSVTYQATIKGENTVNSSARAAMWLYILSTRRAHSRTTDRSSVLPMGATFSQTD